LRQRREAPPSVVSRGEGPINGWVGVSGLNRRMYERFLEKWFGVDPARERDHRPPDHPMVVVGAQVRAARIHASLTQRQVEDLTGIDQSTVSRLENGKGSNLPLGRFAALLIAIDAEIQPVDRPVPSWMAPLLAGDEGPDDGSDIDPAGWSDGPSGRDGPSAGMEPSGGTGLDAGCPTRPHTARVTLGSGCPLRA
jgi:transcriptional regulator with XRE-family HTH domain